MLSSIGWLPVSDSATTRCIAHHAHDPDRPRPAAAGTLLCRGHLADLVRTLGELPDQDADLNRAHGPGQARPGAAGPGLPIDPATARHRTDMAAVVASWCRIVVEDRHVTPPPSAELADTVPWLLAHLQWCAGQPWAADMLTEMRDVAQRARALVDIRPRVLALAARCLVHIGGQRCTGAITIVIRGDDWTAVCDACGTLQDAAPYLRGVRGGRWITADGVIVLARLHGLPASRDVVRQWHHRRRITGRRMDGATWYDLASVQRYLAQRQRSAA